MDTPGSETATLPVNETKELFVTLGKALRAFQLYDENNPVYQRFVQALSASFAKVLDGTQSVTIAVEEERLTLEGVEVYRSASRADSLAFLLYKDGLRTLTFQPGLDGETERLLKALNTARHARTDGDDLLTLLWEADLTHLQYRYVDLLAEGVDVPGEGDVAGAAQALAEIGPQIVEEAEGEDADGSPEGAAEEQSNAATVNRDDFNPTLYALDPKEMERLRQELEAEHRRDVRGDVLHALFDRLEEPNPTRQDEIIEILRTLLPAFLSRGELAAAATALNELRALEQAGAHFAPEQRNQVATLLNEVSSPETIGELMRALEDGALSPSPEELGVFLENLRAGALGALLRASETSEVRDLQPILREAVVRIAQRNEMALVGLLRSDDPVVAAAAARLVGRNKLSAGIDGLVELLGHPDPGVRLAAVEAATALRASPAASPLQDVLLDPVSEVRIAAAKALGALRYGPAAARLKQVIQSKEVRSADITERIAMFEAYGTVAGDAAIDVLDGLLNSKGFLGRREPAEIRACAALGLGRISGGRARDSLMKAAKDEDAVVRSAVGRAIRTQDELRGGPS